MIILERLNLELIKESSLHTLLEEKDINFKIKYFKIILNCIDVVIHEAFPGTKREAQANRENLPTSNKKVVGEGEREASEEGKDISVKIP